MAPVRYALAAPGTTATLPGGSRRASRWRRPANSVAVSPGASSPSASSCGPAPQRHKAGQASACKPQAGAAPRHRR